MSRKREGKRQRPKVRGKERPERLSRPIAARALKRTVTEAHKRYGRVPNVLGVGIGTKFVGGEPTDVDDSVQFFVRRKTTSRARTRVPLPKFVWVQAGRGKRRTRRKLVTDVIEVGRVAFACGAGTEVGTTGRDGVATLFFQNKLALDRGFYLITCAHVVGNIRSPSTDRDVTSECCDGDGDGVVARTVAMTGVEGSRLRYDVAIAKLTASCVPQPDCEVNGESEIALRRFVGGSAIRAGMTVRCAMRGESTLTGGVLSVGEMEVGGVLTENLCLTNITVRFGDSGSLVYRDDAVIGIVVARSETDGFGWFQPLGDALAYLSRKSGIEIRCFND